MAAPSEGGPHSCEAVKHLMDASGGHGYAGNGGVLRVAPGVDTGEGAPPRRRREATCE